MNKVKRILICSFLLASQIVLERFLSIRTPILSIGFGFLPLMLMGILLGRKYTVINAVLADLIGALLFPSGAYFFGFTVTAFLKGMIYGTLLHQKNKITINKMIVLKLLLCVLLDNILLNIVLNTIWIFIITDKAAKLIVPARIIKNLIMIPIETTAVLSIIKAIGKKLNEFRKA